MTETNPLQQRIHALRREADQLECEMRGVELGVFLFEKQTAYLATKHEAAMKERQACISDLKTMKEKCCSDPTSDAARTLDAAMLVIWKRGLADDPTSPASRSPSETSA